MSGARGTKRLAHAIEWIALAGFAAMMRLLPRDAARACGAFLGRFAFDVLRIRRTVAIENVMLRLTPAGGARQAARIARASYEVVGRTFADLLRADRFPGDAIWSAIARDEVERTLQRIGDGACILVSGHFGNWELFANAAARLRPRVGVIAGDQANVRVGDAVVDLRARVGVRTFSSRTGIRDAIRFLREGGMLATLMDQDARRKGIFVPFLGTPASSYTGIAALALREGVPLYPIAILDAAKPARVLEGTIWRGRPEATEDENLREAVEQFSRFLEEQVRAHPEQYFWAHRRWKTRPPE